MFLVNWPEGNPDTGDAVVEGTEGTGIVPSDPRGVMVHPIITTHKTRSSETQAVFMDRIDSDIVQHPLMNRICRLIMIIDYCRSQV
jgi:hypothetical protein